MNDFRDLNNKELLKVLEEILKELDKSMSGWVIQGHIREILNDLGVENNKLW